MWKIYSMVFSTAAYILFLLMCNGETCSLAQSFPWLKITLQLLSFGLMVACMPDMAFRTNLRLAKKGNRLHQTQLAWAYYKGRGAKKSDERAYYWACVSMAAAGKDPKLDKQIAPLISKLTASMSQENRKKIENQAKAWKPSTVKRP